MISIHYRLVNLIMRFCSSLRFIFVLLLLSLVCFVLLYWSISKSEELNLYENEIKSSTDKKGVYSGQQHGHGADEIQERKMNISQLCKQFHLGKYKWSNNSNDLNIKEPPTPLFSYFFWNRERHLSWCPVYKAGSTSWLQNMLRLAGYSEETIANPPKQLSIWAREVYGDADNFNDEEVKRTLKLIVVRHPFERLLSAYRDKLANATVGHEHGTHHFYLKYGKRIVQKFRKSPLIQQKEPTWEEFVRYILKTDLIQYADDHWLPAYYSCTPCLVDYDIVAKTETYFRDQNFIIDQAGLKDILKPRWSHSTVDSQSQNRNQLKTEYFGKLTKTQVQQLYEKYKLDFLLFGYDHNEYIKLAKDK